MIEFKQQWEDKGKTPSRTSLPPPPTHTQIYELEMKEGGGGYTSERGEGGGREEKKRVWEGIYSL